MNAPLTWEEVISEVDWLLSFDVHPDLIAQELGRSLASIEKLARDHGRKDLSREFGPYAGKLRYAA